MDLTSNKAQNGLNLFIDAVQAWKSAGKKLRKDALFSRLTDEQLAEILKHLDDAGVSYQQLREIIAEKFHLRLSTNRTLSEFYSSTRPFVLAAQKLKSASIGSEEKISYIVRQAAFEVLNSPNPHPRRLAAAVDAVLRMNKNSLAARARDSSARNGLRPSI